MKRFLVVLILGLVVLTGCSNTSSDEEVGGHLVMADAGWDSIRFHNAVVGYIAETAFNYTWEEVPGSTAITYEALKNGEIQIYTEVWTDSIAPYYDDVDAGIIEEKGVNFEDNAQGLYVPRWVIEGDAERGLEALAPNLVTVADLANYADIFADPDDPTKGRIYGGPPGWNISEILAKKVEYLGLDSTFNYFQPGSDTALAAVLADSYESGVPVVGYYWEPTWLLGKYDFVRLTDEPYNADTYFDGIGDIPSVRVTVATSPNFADDHPEMDTFLQNYQTSSALTSAALAYMQDTGADYTDTAKWFLSENQDLVELWLQSDAAQAVIDSLS